MASGSTENGKGRQKIKMKKIENESNLQVTFSKRRHGVFKKAYELSILTGAEVAAIVFSPGGNKVYTFGHPSTKAVTERFLTGTSQPLTLTQQRDQATRNDNVAEINVQIAKAKEMLEFEKSRGEELKKALSEGQGQRWDRANLGDQNMSQLQQRNLAFKNAQVEFEREINRRDAAKQSYMVETGGYSNYGVEGEFPLLVGPTYEGHGGSGSGGNNGGGGLVLPSPAGGQRLFGNHGVGDGGLPNIFGVGSSVVGTGVGGLSFGDGPSPYGGGGPNSFIGSGKGNGFPNTDGAGNCGGGSTSRAFK